MENVFNFRDKLIDEYSSFARSFVSIAAADIKNIVEQQYAEGRYWPQPLIQINPNYQRKQTVQELAAQGVLHPTCGEIFKTGKAAGKSDPLYLYKHQIEALAKGQNRQSYVVTTGTDFGKSLAFFIPVVDDRDSSRDCTVEEKAAPAFTATPRYWVAEGDVNKKLADKGWERGWLMGWRDITNATNERTVIASVVPRSGVGNQMPLLFANVADARLYAALLANFAALALDFVARHKTGGTHMNYFIFKQLPILPPERYTDTDLAFIVPRVLELTFTAHDLASWARDLGYDGAPFAFDPARRAQLRAELDAYYARLYGLNREELRYILDPADVLGDDYPSETFRVLKKNELNEFGEYRTRRLVLEAWDKLEAGELR